MKTYKIILLVILLLFPHLHLCCYSYPKFDNKSKIDEKLIERLSQPYFSEKYQECIDICDKYLGYRYIDIIHSKHPYREWGMRVNNKFLLSNNNIFCVADLLYLGSVSAYNFSLSNIVSGYIVDGIYWGMACEKIYSDYLQEVIPNKMSTIEQWANYIQYGVRALEVARCIEHLCEADSKEFKKEIKWIDKEQNKILKILYNNLAGKDAIFEDYTLLQYKINNICSTYILTEKKNLKDFQELCKKRIKSFENLVKDYQTVHQSNNDEYFLEICSALTGLTTLLTHTVIEDEFRKKAGADYERFCMENLIKLTDISYALNGSKRYSLSPSYSLEDIQNHLEDSDCAIIHFEAPVLSGSLYNSRDLGTRYRNYALIITKDEANPTLWHRGFINNNKVNDLDGIKEEYPNIKRYYFVGTPRMSFIDIARNDSSIVRLHSLSQLLQPQELKYNEGEITFIGDLNYTDFSSINEGRESNVKKYDPLIGPAYELIHIEKLFSPKVNSITGDNATRNVVSSEIARSKGIVHISTHGNEFDIKKVEEIDPIDLILKRNIMENSSLILSGYNDSPESPLCTISGADILKIKKINSTIVFIDACLSGQGAVGAAGAVGIAEAFHLIGAKNVICYLESINDDIATEFSNKFYTELANGQSCHDAFYSAKNSINQKINIVLWE